MQRERKKEKSKSNQYLVLLPFAFKPASILIGTLAQSQKKKQLLFIFFKAFLVYSIFSHLPKTFAQQCIYIYVTVYTEVQWEQLYMGR